MTAPVNYSPAICPTDRDLDPYGHEAFGGIPPRNMARYDRARMACAAQDLAAIEAGGQKTPATYTPIITEEGLDIGIPGIEVGKDGKQILPAVPASPATVAPTPANAAPGTTPRFPEAAK